MNSSTLVSSSPPRSRFVRYRSLLSLLALLSASGTHGSQPTTKDAPASRREESAGKTLSPGDSGRAVEDLQRRLNARITPSPGLDTDGDYGDATRAAVARFQRSKGIEASGIADPKTLEALGNAPIVEPEVPAPETVNALIPPKHPADPLEGPPWVTAKAWAIADGKTGKILAGDHEKDPLPMASTTKMMTVLVVMRLVAANPGALDETVTFSERADRTPGSTSGVRAGEKLPVRELLYGLLLPSGNDASVALAEHFGGRVSPPAESPKESDPLARFVAEMNRVAAELGLHESRFANPHGLPAADHHASTRDLATIARHALNQPEIAKVVATRKRGCTLVDGSGSKRNVLWTNTNRLLDTEGYDGVKTGTTTAAGACLIASGRRGDDHLIVVILGSNSSDSRYIDARNLFRWGWKTLIGASTGSRE